MVNFVNKDFAFWTEKVIDDICIFFKLMEDQAFGIDKLKFIENRFICLEFCFSTDDRLFLESKLLIFEPIYNRIQYFFSMIKIILQRNIQHDRIKYPQNDEIYLLLFFIFLDKNEWMLHCKK